MHLRVERIHNVHTCSTHSIHTHLHTHANLSSKLAELSSNYIQLQGREARLAGNGHVKSYFWTDELQVDLIEVPLFIYRVVYAIRLEVKDEQQRQQHVLLRN